MTNHYSRWKILALFASTALACLTACTNPKQEWAIARESLTTAQDAIVALHPEVLSDEDVVATSVILQPAQAAIWKAWTYLPDGGPAFDRYLESIKAAIAESQKIANRELSQ